MAPSVAAIAHHTALSTSPTDWSDEQLEEIHNGLSNGEQSKSPAILPFQVPVIQQQQSAVPVGRQVPISYASPDGKYES